MPLTLNTAHALYPNLVALFVTENDVIKDLVTPGRTITAHASVTYGAGTYGRHFRVSRGASYTVPQGVDFSPELVYDTNSVALSWFAAFNDIDTSADNPGRLFGNPTSNSERWPNMAMSAGGTVFLTAGQTTASGGSSTTNVASGTARTVAVTRPTGDTNTNKLYVDGVLEVTGNAGFASSSARANYIGGHPGFNSLDANIFVLPVFNRVLTLTEIAALHASLTGGGAFALFTGSQVAPPPSDLSGNVTLDAAVGAGTLGSSASDLSGNVSADPAVAAGTLGVQPGVITTTPLRSKLTKFLLPNTTIPKVAVIRVSDMQTVLTLVDVQTNAQARLVVTNFAVVAGSKYLVATCNSDGSAYGAEVCTAA